MRLEQNSLDVPGVCKWILSSKRLQLDHHLGTEGA